MSTVFISHATGDATRAQQVCAHLESQGHRCWIAPRDIRAGHEYAPEIIRGIESSHCLVLILSHAANESPFVKLEVERAVAKRKPVFPVRIEDVMPSPSLELFLSAVQFLDVWSGVLRDHVARLSLAIEASGGARDAKVPRTEPPPPRARPQPSWRWATSAGIAGVVLAGFAFWKAPQDASEDPGTPPVQPVSASVDLAAPETLTAQQETRTPETSPRGEPAAMTHAAAADVPRGNETSRELTAAAITTPNAPAVVPEPAVPGSSRDRGFTLQVLDACGTDRIASSKLREAIAFGIDQRQMPEARVVNVIASITDIADEGSGTGIDAAATYRVCAADAECPPPACPARHCSFTRASSLSRNRDEAMAALGDSIANLLITPGSAAMEGSLCE
jgi:hypothetical protein